MWSLVENLIILCHTTDKDEWSKLWYYFSYFYVLHWELHYLYIYDAMASYMWRHIGACLVHMTITFISIISNTTHNIKIMVISYLYLWSCIIIKLLHIHIVIIKVIMSIMINLITTTITITITIKIISSIMILTIIILCIMILLVFIVMLIIIVYSL